MFPKKISMKNIQLGDQLSIKMFLKFLIFKILYFLKLCPIFVGFVHKALNDVHACELLPLTTIAPPSLPFLMHEKKFTVD